MAQQRRGMRLCLYPSLVAGIPTLVREVVHSILQMEVRGGNEVVMTL
jgi:hypothetical protein